MVRFNKDNNYGIKFLSDLLEEISALEKSINEHVDKAIDLGSGLFSSQNKLFNEIRKYHTLSEKVIEQKSEYRKCQIHHLPKSEVFTEQMLAIDSLFHDIEAKLIAYFDLVNRKLYEISTVRWMAASIFLAVVAIVIAVYSVRTNHNSLVQITFHHWHHYLNHLRF